MASGSEPTPLTSDWPPPRRKSRARVATAATSDFHLRLVPASALPAVWHLVSGGEGDLELSGRGHLYGQASRHLGGANGAGAAKECRAAAAARQRKVRPASGQRRITSTVERPRIIRRDTFNRPEGQSPMDFPAPRLPSSEGDRPTS
jgi:hypothetical protein